MQKLKISISTRDSSKCSRVFLHPKTMGILRVGAAEAVWLSRDDQVLTIATAWPSIATSLSKIDVGQFISEQILYEDGKLEDIEVCRVNEALMEAASVNLEPELPLDSYLKENDIFLIHLRNHLQSMKWIMDGQSIEISFVGSLIRFRLRIKPGKVLVYPRNYLVNVAENPVPKFEVCDKAFVMVERTELKISGSLRPVTSAVSFDYNQIGGLKEQISIVRETVETPLLYPHVYTQFGLKPHKGILLFGPPGTGKTLIARAVAAQTNAKFFVINGAELMSKYVGETETRICQVFQEARENAPSIVFIDEIDSLCPKRDESGHETEKRIVATMLTLLDGISFDTSNSSANVVVLAATNRPNSIDPALRRPGRFDREVEIGVPNPLERLEILQILLKNVANNLLECDVKHIADTSHGYVGADLLALVREAGMLAIKRWKLLQIESCTDLSLNLSSLSITDSKHNNISPCLTMTDLIAAKTIVRPSAMREITLQITQTRWDDIGGMKEQKQALQESIVFPLKYPQTFKRLNITPPKGVLLYGPPGCSKTLLAKALATEADQNFFLIKAGEIFNPYVGESERMVREVFRKAKSNSPSIIFFDEIDSIALRRENGSSGSSKVGDRVLTTLLTEMDGVESLEHVFVVGATNRPDVLDPALMRPGRFDRILYVSPPDEEARREIFKIEKKKMKITADLEDLVDKSEGYTGAEIVGLCKEAALASIRDDPENASQVDAIHFEAAFKRMKPRLTKEMLDFYENFSEKMSRDD